LLVKFLDH